MYISSLVLLYCCAITVSLALPTEPDVVGGKWIVKFRPGMSSMAKNKAKARISKPLDHEFSFDGFHGIAGTLTDDEVVLMREMEDVEYIEPNAKVSAYAWETQNDAPWGLGRVSHTEPGHSEYTYNSKAGEGTCAYIIDTGIFAEHPEFDGRAEMLANFISYEDDTDEAGHGTHVAGTVGSKTYGVAKKAKLFGVKVLDAYGSGDMYSVLSGINFVVNDAKTRDCPKGVVVNMSLGLQGTSSAIDDAVNAAIESKLFFAVAAGNDNLDAGNYSPGRVPNACTIGSTDQMDRKVTHSNYGSVVDVFAPGLNITSTWMDGKIKTISGTSMATPHVTGLAAYLLSLHQNNIDVRKMCDYIVEESHKDLITGLPEGTKNRLIFNGYTGFQK